MFPKDKNTSFSMVMYILFKFLFTHGRRPHQIDIWNMFTSIIDFLMIYTLIILISS